MRSHEEKKEVVADLPGFEPWTVTCRKRHPRPFTTAILEKIGVTDGLEVLSRFTARQ